MDTHPTTASEVVDSHAPANVAAAEAALAIALHAEAVSRLSDHVADVNKSAAKLREAQAQRQRVLDRATNGEAVSTADLRAADDAGREAERDHALQSAIHDGLRTRADQAEIAALHAKAREHEAVFEAALDQRIEAASRADQAMKLLAEALADLESAGLEITAARGAANRHNHMLEVVATRNAVLAKMERNGWPKTRVRGDGIVTKYRIVLPHDADQYNSKPVPRNVSISAAERGMWARPLIRVSA
jgi:hypothetical protein